MARGTAENPKPVWTVTGTVKAGRGLGKLVGTPTANLETRDKLPDDGVYAAKILLRGRIYYGAAHVGPRPTIENGETGLMEAHILNFHEDIYGQSMEVQLYKNFRATQKFENVSLLLDQIQKDIGFVQAYFGLKSPQPHLYIDKEKRQVKVGEEEVFLSAKEFGVLCLLYSHPGVTLTKGQIYEEIWQEPANGHVHAVENTIYQIRKKLSGRAKGVDFIKTVPGYGYRLDNG